MIMRGGIMINDLYLYKSIINDINGNASNPTSYDMKYLSMCELTPSITGKLWHFDMF